MPEKVKRLRVLAGPNGSGKSTVIFHILDNYNCGHFLNADEIEKDLNNQHYIDLAPYHITDPATLFNNYLAANGKSWIEKVAKEGSSVNLTIANQYLSVSGSAGKYDAAIAADFLRYQLINKDETFTFETVLSDARKITFLQEAAQKGFKVYLYFVCTKDPEINKIRVNNRVALNGHYVHPDKIEKRYYSSLLVLPEIVPFAHRTFLFDNSEEGDRDTLNLVAEIEDGSKLVIKNDDVPWWVQEYVIDKLFEI